VRGTIRARRKFDPALRPYSPHRDVSPVSQSASTSRGQFTPVDADGWRRMDNNKKARLGKAHFLELLAALDATSKRVLAWLVENGLEASRREWVEVTVAPGLPVRYVNLAYTTRCVDAFLHRDGVLEGCELKVSGNDGVCGLTVNEERLLRAGRIGTTTSTPFEGSSERWTKRRC
jgi:hypothetical protein